MTADLVAFLRARYDEREQAATLAEDNDEARVWTVSDDGWDCRVLDGNGDVVVYDEGAPSRAEAEHIADNDPAWVLDDLDSKRRILDEAEGAFSWVGWDPRDETALANAYAFESVLKMLAVPFAGHPDYRTEWRPA